MVEKQAKAAALKEEVRSALIDAGVTLGERELGEVAGALGSAAAAVEAARDSFLEIGRALLLVQDKVGPGGYRALVAAELVPLGEASASKLRRIAQVVREGRLPLDRLPRTVEAAYAAARLPEPDLGRLLQEEVIGPGASRRMILDAARGSVPKNTSGDGPLSPAERSRLERQLARLRTEVARLEARLAQG